MFKNKKISYKLLTTLLSVGVIPALLIAIFSLASATNSLKEAQYSKLHNVRLNKEKQLDKLFDSYINNLETITDIVSTYRDEGFNHLNSLHKEKEKKIVEYFDKIEEEIRYLSKSTEVTNIRLPLDKQIDFLKKAKEVFSYKDAYILKVENSKVLGGTSDNLDKKIIDLLSKTGENVPIFTDYYIDIKSNKYYFYVALPISYLNDKKPNILVLKYDKEGLNSILNDRNGYGKSGETYLISKNNEKFYFKSDMVTMGQGNYRVGFDNIEKIPSYWNDVYERGNVEEVYSDSSNKLVMIVASKIELKGNNWALVSKRDFEEVIDRRILSKDLNIYENFVSEFGFYDLYLIHPKGKVFYSVEKGKEYETNVLTGSYSQTSLAHLVKEVNESKKLVFKDFSPYLANGNMKRAFIGVPFLNKDQVEFIIVVQISIDKINKIINTNEYSDIDALYLVGKDKLLRSDIEAYNIFFEESESYILPNEDLLKKALNGIESTLITKNILGERVLASYGSIKIANTKWAIVGEKNYKKALESVYMLQLVVYVTLLLTLISVAYIAFRISKSLSRPIIELSDWAEDITLGKTEKRLLGENVEEINLLNNSFNKMVDSFEEIEHICSEISIGNFDSEFNLRSDYDRLGISINLMREKFVSVIKRAEVISQGDYDIDVDIANQDQLSNALFEMTKSLREAREFNQRQIFLKGGQNLINETFHGHKDIKELADEVLKNICTYLDIPIGTLFLYEEDKKYKLFGEYTFSPRINSVEKIIVGHGLLGQSIKDKKIKILKNISKDYLEIKSSLGKKSVNNIVALPCIYDDEVIAILELGLFEEIEDSDRELLSLISESIAIGFYSALTRKEAESLLEKTLYQAEELQEQKESLCKANEDLEKQTKVLIENERKLQQQQEELRITNEELEEQTKILKDSEGRLQAQQEELRIINEELEERTKSLEEKKRVVNEKNERLEKAQKEIIKKAKELEIASKYKSEFLANMSHELRTPLNSILILSQLLGENKELSPNTIEYANTINSSGKDLLDLINDILDLSKVEAGKMEVNLEYVFVDDIVEKLKRIFEPESRKKGLDFNVNIKENLEIETDLQRINQILKNLLSNAIKFTEKGSIDINTYKLSRNKRDYIAFEIKDTGIGISKEKVKLIFEAFHQGDGTTSRRFGGTGLGLSISKELSKLLGGEIEVESEMNKGSIFKILLPIKYTGNKKINKDFKAEEFIDKNLNEKKVKKTKVENERNKIKSYEDFVLLIEDDNNFGNILKDMARKKGFESILCKSGEEGVEVLKGRVPKAIILDRSLPGMSGFEVLEFIKSQAELKDVPVHVMSGLDPDEKIKQMGIADYFKKPISLEKINGVFEKIEQITKNQIKKLLIVEDDKGYSESIKAFLEEHSKEIEINQLSRSKEVIDLLISERFDCMILDLGLKDISGVDLLNKIRSEDISQVPIIIYTGRELNIEETELLEKYAETVIIKGPESMNRLLDEANLFLHHIESVNKERKQRLIQSEYSKEEELVDKSILVVDDDLRNVFALTSILENKGMKVEVARNGYEAIEKLNGEEIDLVLMDIMMPEMDGYTAMRKIRKDSRFEKLPIIALTAKAMKEDRDKCINAGANDYMSKPVDVDKLLSLMRVWLY